MRGAMWRRFIERGGGGVLAQSLLMAGVVGLGPLYPGARRAGFLIGSGALLGLGAFFGVGGVLVLGRNRTIFPRPKPDSPLVTRGVYRWVRHPLYTSVILLSAAWSLYWASGPAAGAAAALALLLNAKSRHEERWLLEKFPEYRAYRQRVKRLIPGVY